jgi:DNA polymerase-3 subunit beta
MTNTIIIRNDLLRAAAMFASTEQYRFYLCGVYVESVGERLRLVSTDGKVLFAAQVEIGAHEPVKVIIPLDLIKRLPTTKRKHDHIDMVIEGNKIALTYMGTTISADAIDGAFPDYARIVPNEISYEAAHYDPEQIVQFTKAARLMGTSERPHVFNNGGAPAIVRIVPAAHMPRVNMFGLVMPLIERNIDVTLPNSSWVHHTD